MKESEETKVGQKKTRGQREKEVIFPNIENLAEIEDLSESK